jgi:hypothetical protein
MPITETISERNFELVGQAIGAILATEYPNQTTTENLVVWNERVSGFGNEELPAVNVSYANSRFENHSVISKIGENQYYVDIHTNAVNADGTEADETAARLAQRIAGITEYILSHPLYVRLGFDPGVVTHRLVTDIMIAKPKGESDALSTVIARVIVNVGANEDVNDIQGTTIEEIHTQVKLNETEKGFRFEITE